MTVQFEKPGKAYRKVKEESVTLADENGKYVTHRLPVYMTSAGVPSFAVKLPREYVNAWEHHQDTSAKLAGAHVYVRDDVVSAPSYEALIARVEVISGNFHRHISNVKMRKVIWLYLEITGASERKHLNAPSFSSSRILVGIRSGVYWQVNGSLYVYDGARKDGKFPYGQDLEEEDPGEPEFRDMIPASQYANGIIIPFTKEAWATVQMIEASLVKAADMLLQLAKPEDAIQLLQNGMASLGWNKN